MRKSSINFYNRIYKSAYKIWMNCRKIPIKYLTKKIFNKAFLKEKTVGNVNNITIGITLKKAFLIFYKTNDNI